MTTPEHTKTKRLFLALWPDDAVGQQLFELQQVIGRNKTGQSTQSLARPVIRKNFHITLHFIGSASEDEMTSLIKSLDKIECSAFELVIDNSGCFKRAQSFWVGVKNIPEQLESLVNKTGECVEMCFESYSLGRHHGKFIPHLTLFRKAGSKLMAENFEPVTWQVKNFVLVESKTYAEGVDYLVVKQWRLK